MTTQKLSIALAQMDPAWEDKETNKKEAEALVVAAARARAALVVFPEMTLTGFSMRARVLGEREDTSDTVAFFSALAKRHHIAILFGVIFLDARGQHGRNMAVLVDERGRVTSSYQKIHPFSFADEDTHYEGGKSVSFFRMNGWQATMIVCYDLRFAGLFEAISAKKPDIIFVIANWPEKRIEHWQTLLRARALDTQSMVVGVNRVGKGGGLMYTGHSEVYAPDGRCLLSAGSEAGLYHISLDKKVITEWRKQFPLLRDKKPHIYSKL